MQKYKIVKTLGDGAFGTVYTATNTKTNQIVAIKKMKQKYTNWNECVELRQIKSLRKFTHQNIMKLKEVLLVSEELYMVFQYLEYNLYEVYAKMKEQHKCFTESEIKSMIFQVASGLAHMHKIGFFHRDLKPENLLIYNNVVKLCDLGLARQIRSRPPFTDYVSTRWYRAPQLLLRSTNYNSPVDIFALGCIMAQLYTQAPLFPGANEIDQLNKIVKILGTPEKNDWPQGYKMAQAKSYYFPTEAGVSLAELIPQASTEAIDLMESMLRYSSRKRPTASEQKIPKHRILKHPYFKNITLPEPPPQQHPSQKQITFEQQPNGTKLNTTKQDKNIDMFRVTKEKFKQVRKQDADENNPYRQYENMKLSSLIEKGRKDDSGGKVDDIDCLIREIQEKGKKKAKPQKLPGLSSLPHFPMKQWTLNETNRQPQKKDKSFYELSRPFSKEKEGEKLPKNEQQASKKMEGALGKYLSLERNSRSGKPEPCKFSYSFQPVLNNNLQLPLIKSPTKSPGYGISSLSKQKSGVSTSIYKY